MTMTCNRKKRGRPTGSVARYPGITAFCREYGYAHQHVRACLDGERPYAGKVLARWRVWVGKRKEEVANG